MKMLSEGIFDLDSISHIPILIVGCGGLGNEVLKNLITFHFKNIDIVDPDSIEMSNLHRQFFFTDKDIGKSKVEVAKEKIEKKFCDAKITSHITRVEYLENNFFEKYDIIIGCLDNIEGRIYINNIIFNVKKNIIYIDGGVEGFKGNVKIIKKNSNSACINCSLYNYASHKIPICSIVNKPQNATECILYAVNLLSGQKKTDSIEKSNNTEEKEKVKKKEITKEKVKTEEITKEKVKTEDVTEEKVKTEGNTEEEGETGSRVKRIEEKMGDNYAMSELEGSHEILEGINSPFIQYVSEESASLIEQKNEENEDIVIDEYVQKVYLEAKKKAEEFHITGVTYKLTQSVIENATPTLSSTLMVVASLITKEVIVHAQALHNTTSSVSISTRTNEASTITDNNSVRYTDAHIGDVGRVYNDYADILYVGDLGYYLYYYKMIKLSDCLICNKTYMDLEFKKTDKFSTFIDLLTKKYNAKNYSISSTSCIVYMSMGVLKSVYAHKLHLTFQELIDREEIIEGSGLNAITEKSNDVIFIHFN